MRSNKVKSTRSERMQRRRENEWKVTVPTVALVGVILMAVLLAIVLWSVKRRQNTHLQVTNPGELRQMLPSMVGLTQGSMEIGNSVQILQNGAFFTSLLEAIAGAKETIHLESYVWWKGEICRQVATALAQKARQGLEVRVLLDASGSSRMDDDVEAILVDGGVKLARFHPIRVSNLGRLNNRDHRKIMVIDGRIGYVGGHGFAEEWTGNGQDKKHWRDTFVKVEGPIVNRLQSAFTENWIEETGEVPAGDKYFPVPVRAGNISTHLAYSSPAGSVSSVELLHYLAINAAKRELIIQNPYFLPDDDAIKALGEAVKRGVDVRVMVPSDEVNDSPIVQHASHHHFGTLLKLGVKIYEFKKTLLHQKIMIVDGVWSSVGSTNFDDRSFELNDEVSLGILDEGIAEQLRAAYLDDMRFAEERKLEPWKDRGLYHKMIDGLAFLGNEQL